MSELSNFVEVIKACQSAGGAGKKAAIQAALATSNTTTRMLIWYALNPYLTFGVRKWEKQSCTQSIGTTEQIIKLLDDLASRKLTGNAAQEAVTKTLALYSDEEAKFLELVIEKDLKAGFSEDTYNKLWSEADGKYGKIPTFEVMLADKCDSPEEFLEKITFPCQADWKYDGQRTVCFVHAGQPVVYRARSGKPSEHLNGLFDEDLHKLRDIVGYDFVMDGEAFASDFTETINAKKEGNDAAKQALKLRAFFMMPIGDWLDQKTLITMQQNRTQLEELLIKANAQKVLLSEGREVRSYADMVAYCNEVIDTHKQEGLILKNWKSVYQWDRTMDWCKVKRMWDVDGKVIGFYAGRKKSRLENTLGGITVSGKDEHGVQFEVNVGSGFTDEMRSEIWNNRDKYLDTTCTVQYQEMCKAKGSDVLSLRFPVFMHFRDDK